ncbi:Outer envelope protein 64, chloroplastic-like protein, partial [Drosera capensis]
MASSALNLWVLLGLGLAGVLLMTRKFKKAARENFGAFVKRLELVPLPNPPPPKAPLPLSGLSFAVSDVFDINGHVTEFGHPDWARTHEAASQTALVVSTMVEGGATCVGKTVVSEMAFSISGENKQYGTPENPEAPSKVPGGACSGSSVAVSADLVDFALGVDTVGGVRLPAAYCGIIGFRPSHGTVSLSGVIPVSPSLDVVGCFAKDPNVLKRAVHVLLQLQFANQRKPRQILIADDCFEQLKIPIDRVTQPVIRSTEKLFGRQILKHVNIGDHISTKVPTMMDFYGKSMNGAIKSSSLGLLAIAMQFLSLHEFNQNHEEWMKSVNPSLDPVITSRIHNMPKLDEIHVHKLHKIRDDVRSAINSLLKDDGILVLPTFVDSPPKLSSKEISSVDFENRFFCLSSIASMSGCCQVVVPLGTHDKSPVSVSLLARHGGDRFLLDTLRSMYASLQEQTELVSTSKPSSNGAISKEISAEIAKEK